MIAQATKALYETGHIRPFVMGRDLEGLAALIEAAFDAELAVTGSQLVRDMRKMVSWQPFPWITGLVARPFRGFVWVEGDRLVGNVSLTEEEDDPGVWTVSNVAVLPQFRGRGIAGRLVDTAISYLRGKRGRRILLQVSADSQPALALYRRKGFVRFDVVHELDLPENSWPICIGPSAAPLRPVCARDWRGLYRLVESTTPGGTLRCRVRPEHFRRGFWWRLDQQVQRALGGPWCLELVGECQGQIVAYGHATLQASEAYYDMGLSVAPGQRGRWELPLIEGLVGLAQTDAPPGRLRARVSSSHPEALQALHQLGFTTLRTLHQMALTLG